MKFNQLILFLFVSLFYLNANAQKFELGKVSLEELQEKAHPVDTSAAAAILYKKAKTYFIHEIGTGFFVYHDYELRIKIYKKEGLKWADFKVHYRGGDENLVPEAVSFSDCVTYNLENKTIQATKLRTEGNLKTDINKYWNEALITMPNVKVGSIIEIHYTLKSKNVVQFPVFDFQYEIPVNYAEYDTDIPEVFIYKPILTGYLKVNAGSKIVDEKESFSYKFYQTSDFPFKYQLSNYKAENIPALKEEAYVDNLQNYRSSIQHELERTRFPFEKVEDYSITWDGVAKNIFDFNSFGRELNKDGYYEEDLKRIGLNVNSEFERLDVIFKFVKNKMNWNEYKGILTDKGVKKAYKDETGNVAEINFILIAMLNKAGIKADPVLISTRENGVPVYPNRTVFNSVIAAVEIDGKQILLDATNKYASLNILPLPDLNWTGRLINKDGSSKEINLVPDKVSNVNINLLLSINGQGKMVGNARIQKTDYEALNFREQKSSLQSERYLEKLESSLGGILIDDYKLNDDINLSSSIIESFSFVSNKHSDVIGGKIYITPLLFYNDTKNPFVENKRQMPIYFGFPKQEKYNINIEIPPGYKVESLPESVKVSTVDGIASFSINIMSVGNKIQIAVTKEISKAIVSADYYDVLKDFFQQVLDKQNEKIILIKV
ncbi:protein of unknown function [Flavobacterium gillisiae]|uniref:Uncharacterized protein n=1 Tax=Flavobacterium gillisiae TaxID=150146 RepID=A0A1H4CH08_9FLAO|nr:DUF3857 domain-containing protein [Flavobacterium gillisiae]SEA59593.1 protein of unknown function [Flavobacterium gillisiae]